MFKKIMFISLFVLIGCGDSAEPSDTLERGDDDDNNDVGCVKDTDCKGERVCENGKCVNLVITDDDDTGDDDDDTEECILPDDYCIVDANTLRDYTAILATDPCEYEYSDVQCEDVCYENECCIISCGGKNCGDDGCGSNCGLCEANEMCNEHQFCECVPDCSNKEFLSSSSAITYPGEEYLCTGDKYGDGCGGPCDIICDIHDTFCSDTGFCECEQRTEEVKCHECYSTTVTLTYIPEVCNGLCCKAPGECQKVWSELKLDYVIKCIGCPDGECEKVHSLTEGKAKEMYSPLFWDCDSDMPTSKLWSCTHKALPGELD